MYELEKEWQTASDGFVAGIDFKMWLANQVLALRSAAQHSAQPTLLTLPVNLEHKGGASPSTKLHVKSQSG